MYYIHILHIYIKIKNGEKNNSCSLYFDFAAACMYMVVYKTYNNYYY